MLKEINLAFPHARLKVRVIDGDIRNAHKSFYGTPNLSIETLTTSLYHILEKSGYESLSNMGPAIENPDKGIFALSRDTLEDLQKWIVPALDAAKESHVTESESVEALSGLKQTLNEAFSGFVTRYRDNQILHDQIAALEKLEDAYVDNRMAAYDALQHQINGEELTRVLNREAGITHHEISTT